MKKCSLIILTLLSLLSFGQKQKGEDWPLIDKTHIAVFLIDYSDQTAEIKSHFPSKEDVYKELFNPDSTIQKYFPLFSRI